MKTLILLCGPAGSGKSTLAHQLVNEQNYFRVNQDDDGKAAHFIRFQAALKENFDICLDKMNFDRKQRDRYLAPAKAAGYKTKIIVLHENYDTCLERMRKRTDHPTIRDEESARSALNTFFTKYEKPTPDEADEIEFRYPEVKNNSPILIVDIDGTAANIDHRLHYVHREKPLKKDWKGFFDNVHLDTPNEWCKELVNSMSDRNLIVFCSGRPDNLRNVTQEWLTKHNFRNDHLFMRPQKDSRDDTTIKEIILDFEILTRFKNIKFAVDDRKRVYQMWRKRGIVTLACHEGDF